MKIMIIVGARPNFMKVAPILRALRRHNDKVAARPDNDQPPGLPRMEPVLVHTGQHYDQAMSNSFFSDLELPVPDVYLGVGSGSHAIQTAEVMRRFEEVVLRERPDLVVVVGDVNSTLGCALVVAKIVFDSAKPRPLIAHVEAGLRSFDKSMPEEHNRILTDHLSDLLFVTEPSGVRNLKREGIPNDRIHFVGNTMIDSVLLFRERSEQSKILKELNLTSEATAKANLVQPYALLTLHRPSNVDDRNALENILEGLSDLSRNMGIIFPVHPRTRKRIEEFGLERHFQQSEKGHGIRRIDPLGYLDFLCLMKNARLVLTDSGGIQEETTCLSVPCVTIRENTERPVTLKQGTNVLAGTSSEGVRRAVALQRRRRIKPRSPQKWDGNAADRIVNVLANTISIRALTFDPASQLVDVL